MLFHLELGGKPIFKVPKLHMAKGSSQLSTFPTGNVAM